MGVSKKKAPNCNDVIKAIAAVKAALAHEHEASALPLKNYHGLLAHLEAVKKEDKC
eukprot:JP445695.1.p1 GENE.JP445695.1~~JP445695.1.p1  ORF type:complete len:56 (-),score=12.38 JP445695.1:42-209(-)